MRAATLLFVGAATSAFATIASCTPRPLARRDAGAGATIGGADAGMRTDVGVDVWGDIGSVPDAGAPSQDAGDVPAHGAPADTAPVSLAGACGSDLRIAGPLQGTEGTLPAPGPYRPCRLLSGHDYLAIRLSDDGSRAAALTRTGQILVLDSRALTPVAVLARARGPYTQVALSADGAVVAAGSDVDGEVDVWRVADHALVRAFELDPTWPTLGGALALSKDGARVATVAGAALVIADVGSGTIRTLPEDRLATALYFVDGDRKLAFAGGQFWSAGTGQSRIDLIDIETGAVQTLAQHDDIFGVDQLEASSDGGTLLTFGHGELAVWDVATGHKRVLPQPSWEAGRFSVHGLSADGAEIAASIDDDQDIWFQRRRSTDDTVVAERRLDPTASRWYTWSSRAELLVLQAVDADGLVALATVDLAATKLRAKGCSGRPQGQPIGFSADGSRLLTRAGPTLDGGAAVFDVATGRPIESPFAPGAPRTGALGSTWIVSPDWRWAAWTTEVVENDQVTTQVHVVEGATNSERILLAWQSASYGVSIVFSADSRELAAVDSPGGLLTVADVKSGLASNPVPLAGRYSGALDFTPDGNSVLIHDDGGVRTVRWSDGATLAELATGNDDVTAGPDGTVVAFGQSEARTYRDGMALSTMPGIGDFCFGFVATALPSDDGSTVALGASCGRPNYLPHAPHVDIRVTATGALIQQVAEDTPLVFSRDASMFAGARGLLWCR